MYLILEHANPNDKTETREERTVFFRSGWEWDAEDRPDFCEILTQLEDIFDENNVAPELPEQPSLPDISEDRYGCWHCVTLPFPAR